MRRRNFMNLLRGQWKKGKFVCVGLDTNYKLIPQAARTNGNIIDTIMNFNRVIVEETYEIAGAYKPNWAFYLAQGPAGFQALIDTISFINKNAPDIPVILDCKIGDIGTTNIHYIQATLDQTNADAITIHNYLGKEANQLFLDETDKGFFILCQTSNKGAGELQHLRVKANQSETNKSRASTLSLSQKVARNVNETWNSNGNCGLVTGATFPEEIRKIRMIAPNLPLLIPGIGSQGGDLEKTIAFAKDQNNCGFIINSSSGILYPKRKPREKYYEASQRETQTLHDQIQNFLG